jgi:hypothetical protein
MRAESRKIIRGIASASGNQMSFAMAKDENWSFARDSRNFTKLKFVGNKIAEENDPLRRKLLDVISEGQEVDGR